VASSSLCSTRGPAATPLLKDKRSAARCASRASVRSRSLFCCSFMFCSRVRRASFLRCSASSCSLACLASSASCFCTSDVFARRSGRSFTPRVSPPRLAGPMAPCARAPAGVSCLPSSVLCCESAANEWPSVAGGLSGAGGLVRGRCPSAEASGAAAAAAAAARGAAQ